MTGVGVALNVGAPSTMQVYYLTTGEFQMGDVGRRGDATNDTPFIFGRVPRRACRRVFQIEQDPAGAGFAQSPEFFQEELLDRVEIFRAKQAEGLHNRRRQREMSGVAVSDCAPDLRSAFQRGLQVSGGLT